MAFLLTIIVRVQPYGNPEQPSNKGGGWGIFQAMYVLRLTYQFERPRADLLMQQPNYLALDGTIRRHLVRFSATASTGLQS
jgi:hypothetical protein